MNPGGIALRKRYTGRRLLPRLFVVGTLCLFFLPGTARADLFASGGPLFAHANYDYAPSIIEEGGYRKFWWCGDRYPNQGNFLDVVYYTAYNLSTGTYSPIQEVLSPSSSGWDSRYTCDPSVVRGSFYNAYTGQTYGYAMYYTATDLSSGALNRIGVAFSHDGVSWVKYAANPIIAPQSPSTTGYGAGQAATYNVNGAGGIYLFHSDDTPSGQRVFVRTSSNGINFGGPTMLSNLAANPSNPGGTPDTMAGMGGSDFAYDPQSGQFYAAITRGVRAGDFTNYQFGLYRMASSQLLSGQGIWEPLGMVDTNLTGQYLNHNPGLQRDIYGNISPFLPSVRAYFGAGYNDSLYWDLHSIRFEPQPQTVAFKRYYSGYHWVTTGYVAPGYGYEFTLGYLWMAPKAGTIPLYGCVVGGQGGTRHFPTKLADCSGDLVLGLNGYIYDPALAQPAGTVALYRCSNGANDFVTSSVTCEGSGYSLLGLLGYAKTTP